MKLMVLDGNSVINRAYYGVRALTTKDGFFTNAIYGFLNILEKLRTEEQPDALCVTFDLKAPTFRHLAYDGYKATRHPMPDELAMQLPMMKDILRAMRIPIFECEGWEADDVIGTIGKQCGRASWDCVIVTGDRDSLQLIDEHVTVKLVSSKLSQSVAVNYDPARFREEYGFDPIHLIDLKALMGDSSDNIPGVAGVGPKTATQLLLDYGREHVETGALMVYTSADSVLQIAANEADVPVEELYHICEEAREMLQGPELGVGRVIARPYVGEYPNYTRTSNRHDFSLKPPKKTLLDYIQAAGLASIGVGKIYDIFAGQGITGMVRNKSNTDGMDHTLDYAARDFYGLCFVNLVDFDMLYGHRNDVDGYANALTEFDGQLRELLPLLRPDDLLFITADHGCDPSTPSTDHSREHVPMLAYGAKVKPGVNIGTRSTYADLAATVAEYLGVKAEIAGESFLKEILK